MDFPVLETKRLQLTNITEQHIDRYFEIMSKDEVTKYYGMPSLTDREQARSLIHSFSERFAEKKSMRWGIIWRDTNEFIGTVGLNNWSPYSRKAEVGYELHPDFWGKGITTEAVSEVIAYAFTKLELFRIGAVTFPENHSSSKLLEKLGFQKEGVLRGYLYQKEQNHDAFMFSILKREFLGRNNKVTNRFFLLFGAMMVLLFGGVFVIRYFRTGELLADQLIGAAVGAIVFIWAFIWRQRNKIRE